MTIAVEIDVHCAGCTRRLAKIARLTDAPDLLWMRFAERARALGDPNAHRDHWSADPAPGSTPSAWIRQGWLPALFVPAADGRKIKLRCSRCRTDWQRHETAVHEMLERVAASGRSTVRLDV